MRTFSNLFKPIEIDSEPNKNLFSVSLKMLIFLLEEEEDLLLPEEEDLLLLEEEDLLLGVIPTLFRRYSDVIPNGQTLFRRYSDVILNGKTLFRRYSDDILTLCRRYFDYVDLP